jgi:ketosteroid isomerase-like protein
MTTAASDTQQVLDIIQRWAAAELAGDAEAFGHILTPDFTGIGPVGFVLTTAQWAGRHRGDLHNDKFEVLDPHVVCYGDPVHTAVVEAVLKQEATAMGHDASGSFRLGLIAVRTGQDWLIARVQLSGPLLKPGEQPPSPRTSNPAGQ